MCADDGAADRGGCLAPRCLEAGCGQGDCKKKRLAGGFLATTQSLWFGRKTEKTYSDLSWCNNATLTALPLRGGGGVTQPAGG